MLTSAFLPLAPAFSLCLSYGFNMRDLSQAHVFKQLDGSLGKIVHPLGDGVHQEEVNHWRRSLGKVYHWR